MNRLCSVCLALGANVNGTAISSDQAHEPALVLMMQFGESLFGVTGSGCLPPTREHRVAAQLPEMTERPYAARQFLPLPANMYANVCKMVRSLFGFAPRTSFGGSSGRRGSQNGPVRWHIEVLSTAVLEVERLVKLCMSSQRNPCFVCGTFG